MLRIFALFFLFFTPFAYAESVQVYDVNQLLGDGSSGRVWHQWKQGIPEDHVSRVSVRVRKQSGGNNTYINLRYGSGGTLDNGKRVFLRDNGRHEFTFNVNEAPNGRPLVMNAYKGEVVLERAQVFYRGVEQNRSVNSSVIPRPKRYPKPRPYPENYDDKRGTTSGISGGSSESAALRRCREADRIRRPRIEIGELRPSGGLFSGKYRINGEVFGACLEEAGYFEKTRLKKDFEVPLTDRFRRYPFSIQVRGGKRGELRVYTIDGREDVLEIDELIQDFKN